MQRLAVVAMEVLAMVVVVSTGKKAKVCEWRECR